jgi:hypothetical protein
MGIILVETEITNKLWEEKAQRGVVLPEDRKVPTVRKAS